MRNILLLGVLLPGLLPGVAAATCGDLSGHRVDGLVFDRAPVHQAIAETLKGTPYNVIHTAPQPVGLVNATGVSGPLDEVLPNLLDQFGLAYMQTGCDLTVLPLEKRALRLVSGDMLNEKLAGWLRDHGYTLFWDAPKYRVSGPLSVTKTVEGVLNDITSIMRANGVKLMAEIYDNRAVRVTEVKQ